MGTEVTTRTGRVVAKRTTMQPFGPCVAVFMSAAEFGGCAHMMVREETSADWSRFDDWVDAQKDRHPATVFNAA